MVVAPTAAEAPDVDLAQVSKKALASPAGARAGTIGKGMMIRANRSVADDDPLRCLVSSVISPSRSVALINTLLLPAIYTARTLLFKST